MTGSPTPDVREIGPCSVISLFDAEGRFFAAREDVFPRATPEQWAATDLFDPGALDKHGRWHLQFRCFAIRSPGSGVVIVDAGVGPADSSLATWAPIPGRLPLSLEAAGIDPADVECVVLTHLHVDHVGWAVCGDGTGRRPYFPNARYLLQKAELRYLHSSNPGLADTVVKPLHDAGQLCLVNGEERLSAEVNVVPTPGHTPGHQSVLVRADDRVLAVAGDALVHAVQMVFPDVAYLYESDPEEARETRRKLFAIIAEGHGVLATAHLTKSFVELV